jgi:hypothetical protein
MTKQWVMAVLKSLSLMQVYADQSNAKLNGFVSFITIEHS